MLWGNAVNAWRLFEFSIAVVMALVQFFRRQGFRSAFSVTTQQVYFTGVEAMPFLGMLSLLLGFVVIAQSLPQLQGVGAHALIGQILVISIVRELGPIITAMVVITRSGSAMATEMATNRISGQVESLEAMGIDIFHFLVVPRVLGCMISMFCMILFFDIIALVGGFLVASTRLTMPFTLYLQYIFTSLAPLDLYLSLSKGLLFGGIIAFVGCYKGLTCGGGAEGVGKATNEAVVQASIIILVSNLFITLFLRNFFQSMGLW